MNQFKYKFKAKIKIKFEEENLANWIFYSLYPDVKRTKAKDFETSMTKYKDTIEIEICAYTLAKFKGLFKTVLRLLHVLDSIYKHVIKK